MSLVFDSQIGAAPVDPKIVAKLSEVLDSCPSLGAVFRMWNDGVGTAVFSRVDRNILRDNGLWDGEAPAAGVREALGSLPAKRL